MDEIAISLPSAKQLVSEQFPHWAELAIGTVNSAGTDNTIFRLGPDMALRFPRRQGALEQAQKEARWLPLIAPHLPLAVPLPIAMGKASSLFPYDWAVCRWLDGENALLEPVTDWAQAASSLAAFVSAMQRMDAKNGPAPGDHNFWRGVPLSNRDKQTREAIASLGSMGSIVDIAAVLKAWKAALAAPAWDKPPTWIHGDLHAGNLLVKDGKLSAVIDFGGLGVGDPACDLMVAWTFLTPEARVIFRKALSVDDAAWQRGRGWALSFGLIALPYYLNSNKTLAGIARYAIEQALYH